MSKPSILIIEDEFFAASHLQQLLHSMGYQVAGVFHSGEEFLKNNRWDFDAAIVDIFLSGKVTGLHIAEKLNERLKPFIFLTANQDAQTLKNAARLRPKAYISKPFQNNDVQAALEIISLGLMSKIQVKTQHGHEELHPSDILFIRSDGAYIEIVTLRQKVVQRKLLKEIEQQLPPSFIRVHRSYIVNKAYISQRTASVIKIHAYQIPVSRSFRDNLEV